ncbi:serine/threonine protein kinase [Streptomyces sp. NPDC056399]|uniref:serine/threonine protein kinase n=1 Tax=Streptomyces sp. NPDC056399 TaxID=3345807 RepID=UPI0035D7E4FE
MTRHDILGTQHVDDLEPFLQSVGDVFTVFPDQDSGCVSYGLRTAAGSYFVKTAAIPSAAASLCQALAVHQAVKHPAIIPIVHSFTTGTGTGTGLAVVYPWADGEVLYHPTKTRSGGRAHPDAPMARFRRLPVPTIHKALDVLLDAHLAVEAAGLVAVDLYDGTMLYDFTTHTMRLCDLDHYRPGPFTLEADRLPGSTRYMAPEEHLRGALITPRTTVFTLGRALRLLLDAGDTEQAWRGTPAQLAVITTATGPDPADRHASVSALAAAWRTATGT